MKFTALQTVTATGSANGATHTPDPSGPDSIAVIAVGGTFTTAALAVEGKMGGGTLWVPLLIVDRKTGLRYNGSVTPSDSTASSYQVDIKGMAALRVYPASGTVSSGMTFEILSGTDRELSGPANWNAGVGSGGGLLSTGPGVGYATGAGGAVTQITTRSTGVTLSKLTGQITTDTTSLAAGAEAEFTVTNTLVAATDTVVVSLASGNTGVGTCVPVVTAVAAGSFKICITNLHASTAETGACVLNFAVLKGVAA